MRLSRAFSFQLYYCLIFSIHIWFLWFLSLWSNYLSSHVVHLLNFNIIIMIILNSLSDTSKFLSFLSLIWMIVLLFQTVFFLPFDLLCIIYFLKLGQVLQDIRYWRKKYVFVWTVVQLFSQLAFSVRYMLIQSGVWRHLENLAATMTSFEVRCCSESQSCCVFRASRCQASPGSAFSRPLKLLVWSSYALICCSAAAAPAKGRFNPFAL